MIPGVTIDAAAIAETEDLDMSPGLGERVAVVETRVDGLDQTIAEIKPELKRLTHTVTLWGGALLILVPIGSAVFTWAIQKFGG